MTSPALQLLVNLDVPDVNAAAAFYTAAFGFTVSRRLGADFLELAGAGIPVYLLEKAPGTPPFPGATAPRHYGRHWSPVHLDLVVPALEPAVDRAVAAGATREGDVVEARWGRMQILADPFGHGVCLLEMRGRGYGELEGAGEG
jgi:lactoylglutathione lyase